MGHWMISRNYKSSAGRKPESELARFDGKRELVQSLAALGLFFLVIAIAFGVAILNWR